MLRNETDREKKEVAVSGEGIPGSENEWNYLKPSDAAGFHILIVEDDGMIAFHTASVLERAGFSVLMPVASGEEALECLLKPPYPDLVLMDIQLAGRLDGIETAQRIAEQAVTPVIFISAWSDNPRIVRAALTKPYGYLVKPVSDRELLATVATTLYRHSVDQKLAESEGRYRALVDNAAEGILLLAYGTHAVVEANMAFLQLAGYSRGDALPSIGEILACPADKDRSGLERVLSQGGRLQDARLECRDGSHRDVDVAGSIICRKGEPAFVSLLMHDVTGRKRAEEALSTANKKLNLLSEITRHDILNQLTKLRGWLEISLESLEVPEKTAGFIEKEIRVADAIASLISFTRDYQNMGVSAPVWQDAGGAIRSVLSQPPRTIDVVVDMAGIEIYADPLFPKVMYNLIDNAARHGGDAVSSLRFSAREGESGLVLVAEDDGVGIPSKEKERIFRRGVGKNTGLGLFISREILGITGFSIAETGEPGRGARFEIAIPRGKYRFSGSGEAQRTAGSATP